MDKHCRDAGFSLAALLFFAAAASILAAAAVPAYQMQAKRELEKELIFRGEEYTRAIQKYQRKFGGVYPGSIDQLVQTNGLRFLRRAYKDPVTGKDFRLIRINPDGSLSGSKLFVPNANQQSLFGNTQTFGSQPGASQQQQQTTQSQQPSQPPLSSGPQPQLQAPQPQQRPGQPLGSTPFTPIGNAGIGNAGGTPIAAGGIIGVGSNSDETSVMVYNQRQKYSEWEFIAILGQTGPQQQRGPQVGGPQVGGPQVGGPQVGNPQFGGPQFGGPQVGNPQFPGPQPQNTPFPSPMPGGAPSPFGPQPGGFGSFPGPQQGQQPFGGFGNNPTFSPQPAPAKRP